MILTLCRRTLATRRAVLLRDFELKGKVVAAGDVVVVAAGYLRNYLLPRNIAVPATERNLLEFQPTSSGTGQVPLPELTRGATVTPSARTPFDRDANALKFARVVRHRDGPLPKKPRRRGPYDY